MIHRRGLLKAFTAMSLPSVTAPAFSQAAYPSKAINMVCGFAAGSATDVVARVVGMKLSERLGQARWSLWWTCATANFISWR